MFKVFLMFLILIYIHDSVLLVNYVVFSHKYVVKVGLADGQSMGLFLRTGIIRFEMLEVVSVDCC